VNKLIEPEPVISFELSYWFTLMLNYSIKSKQKCYAWGIILVRKSEKKSVGKLKESSVKVSYDISVCCVTYDSVHCGAVDIPLISKTIL
jgi:hypothetical protein